MGNACGGTAMRSTQMLLWPTTYGRLGGAHLSGGHVGPTLEEEGSL